MTVPIVPGEPTAEPTLATLMPSSTPPKLPGWVVPVIAGLGVLLVATAGLAIYAVMRPAASTVAAPTTTTPARPAVVQPTTTRPKVWTPPTAQDLVLTVKTLKQTCFGSAGCNVTYTIEVIYSGPELEPGQTWDVTYTVAGGDDPQIYTLELLAGSTANEYRWRSEREERISTPSASSVLTATVTSVSEH